MTEPTKLDLLTMTTEIVVANVSGGGYEHSSVVELISQTYAALEACGQPAAEEDQPEYTPAVHPRKSVTPDHIVSLIDGTKHKMLRRHLSNHGLTPEQYRQRYNLSPDYPMTAPNYAERRREIAIENGLGKPKPKRAKSK